MVFQNARYCNGFPTLRRNSDTLGVSIHSILSDVFSLFPYFPVTKMVTVELGARGLPMRCYRTERTSITNSSKRDGAGGIGRTPEKP